MQTQAVLMSAPGSLDLQAVSLTPLEDGDVVVRTKYSGISTGTEKLFWTGDMPTFPGMGYPLVPGYEAVGEVVDAGKHPGLSVGDMVFVPGANCYADAHGLFGASSRHIVTAGARLTRLDNDLGARGVLLALAATAHHALAVPGARLPELIVGHGTVGRLLARLTIAKGGPPPIVHEIDQGRRTGADAYGVVHPSDDPRKDYASIYDASGHGAGLDGLIGRLSRGGEIVLAGFYAAPLSFAFPPAFMREARLRIAAEWTAEDMTAVCDLINSGRLSLDGLLTHSAPAADAAAAYKTAFEDSECLKMVLNWENVE